MSHASICICTDSPEEQTALANWLEQWRSRMTFISENRGDGCCVEIFDVEGPEEAIAALPEKLRVNPDWSENEDHSKPVWPPPS